MSAKHTKGAMQAKSSLISYSTEENKVLVRKCRSALRHVKSAVKGMIFRTQKWKSEIILRDGTQKSYSVCGLKAPIYRGK